MEEGEHRGPLQVRLAKGEGRRRCVAANWRTGVRCMPWAMTAGQPVGSLQNPTDALVFCLNTSGAGTTTGQPAHVAVIPRACIGAVYIPKHRRSIVLHEHYASTVDTMIDKII